MEASSTLIFPRLSFAPDDLIGIAIVNPGDETASVTFTAYGVNGQVLQPEGSSPARAAEKHPQGAFINPASFDIPPGQQFAEVTIGIFGSGIDPQAIGWVEATSEADDLTGFFQVLDFDISFLDGADLPVPDSRLIFQDVRVDGGFSTTAYLLNPNGPGTASVELSLVTSESIKTKNLEISAKGIAELNVEGFFEGVEPAGEIASEAYLIADSNVEIAGFELVGKEGEDLLGLNARPAGELLTTLFFPQLAVLGPFITEAVIGNFSEEAAIVTMTAFRENGEIYADEVENNPVVVVLDPGEILRADLEETFGFSGKTTLEGWLKVESTSASINGSISYSIPSRGTIASVSSVREGSRRALISHLGTAPPFFTGLAVLNAGALAANVRVVALTKEGEVLGTFTTTLQPGERISQPVTDLIPGAGGQNGGMLWIESDVPVYLTAIFGSATVFANVPPQPVPESFEPDMGIDQIGVTPPLAVLAPAQVQQFELDGSMTVPMWGVNGITGGNVQTGTISGTGLYTAPAVIPMALPLTIMAAADNQTAGASVDVQTKTVLVGGLGIVQSVAYLAGLDRLYTSELSFGSSPSQEKRPQGSEQSTIFDVTTGSQQSVAVFGDDIPKMIPYLAGDGNEYLLLAGRTSGSIRRLDPGTGTSVEVASGLNAPNSLVIDPVSGDLLVAEADQVSTLPASQLNQGLAGAGLAEAEIPVGARQLAAGLTPTGIAVDRCTGNVYVSQASTGEVLVIDRLTGEVRTIAEGLSEPGQLLGFYRSGISCPDAFHLLVIETFFFPEEEREASQITLLVPSTGLMTLWLAESSAVIPDITLLPPGSSLTDEAVLIAENFGEGQISKVEVIGRYDPDGINPPGQPASSARVEMTITGHQLQSMTCNDPLNSTWEDHRFGNFQFAGILPLDGAAIISGSWWDYNGEFRVGTGLFAGVSDEVNVDLGTLEVEILPDQTPTSATDVSGTWKVTVNDFEDEEEGEELEVSVTQNGNVLSAVIPEEYESEFLIKTGCTVSCSAPGVCTAQCPNGVTYDLTCDPATPAGCQFDAPLIGTVTETDSQPSVPEFEDPNLEAAVRDQLGIGPADPLTVALAQTLTLLDASSRNIQSLNGLESLSNLTVLGLQGNPISDIGPLEGLRELTLLSLIGNSISDIGPLEGLKNLTILAVEDNLISDISPLAGLTQLRLLGLVGNSISDITPLAGLTQLILLDLHHNSISNLTALAGLTRLRVLSLHENAISDLTALAGLTRLRELELHLNSINDIAPLVANPGLGAGDFIDLSSNPLNTGDCANLQTLIDRGANVSHDVNCP